jgi:ribosome-binding factor A
MLRLGENPSSIIVRLAVVSKLRSQRIADRIREELSEILIFDVNDPRLVGASITDVSVDRELAYADVYVSSLAGSEDAPEILAGFEHASGYLRSELARRIDLRLFPQLRFHWDPIPEHAENIEKLLDIIKNDNPNETENHPANG